MILLPGVKSLGQNNISSIFYLRDQNNFQLISHKKDHKSFYYDHFSKQEAGSDHVKLTRSLYRDR